MKRGIIVIMLVLFMVSILMPAYADEAQAKRAANHQNIADLITDTLKLPMILIGILGRKNVEQIKKDLDYKNHEGLEKCIRKKEVK